MGLLTVLLSTTNKELDSANGARWSRSLMALPELP